MPTQKSRPLSPHLQIYRPQMTSVLSIMHRMAGVALTLGLFLITWGLIAAAMGPESFECFIHCITHPLGKIALFGWTLAITYHMANGIRHLVWDTGRLFKIEHATRAGYIVLLTALALTAIIWSGV